MYLFTNFVFQQCVFCDVIVARIPRGDTFISVSTRKSAIFSALLLAGEKSFREMDSPFAIYFIIHSNVLNAFPRKHPKRTDFEDKFISPPDDVYVE